MRSHGNSTPVQRAAGGSSTLLAAGGMSAREPRNTLRVQASARCGGPSSSERVPCDSHGLERGARDAGFRNWGPAVDHGSLNGSASGGASDPAGPGSAGTSGCAMTAFPPGTPLRAGSKPLSGCRGSPLPSPEALPRGTVQPIPGDMLGAYRFGIPSISICPESISSEASLRSAVSRLARSGGSFEASSGSQARTAACGRFW